MVTKRRSPNYPRIDLGKAVERTRQLYRAVERGEFTSVDAAKAWGYSRPNGLSQKIFGALKQYGLVEQRKGQNGTITPRGVTVSLRDATSAEYVQALAEAATEPPLFAELLAEGRADSARDALLQHLVVNRDFTTDGASRFIDVFQATKPFAAQSAEDEQVAEGDHADGGEADDGPAPERGARDDSGEPASNQGGARMADEAPRANDATRVPLRLSGGYVAVVELPTAMTEQAWAHMLQYLEVMKPAYINDAVHPVGSSPQSGGEQE